MKKFKLTNKGMSIESAVVFMIVIFMFCSIITSLTLYSSYQAKTQNIYLERKIELDQIGESYVAYMRSKDSNTSFSINNSKYLIDIDTGTDNTLKVYYASDTEKSNPILSIQLDDDKNIIKWNYSN